MVRGGSNAILSTRPGTVGKVLPASALGEGDLQAVSVNAAASSTGRSISVYTEALGTTAMDLPPRLEDVQFGADESPVSATWLELPVTPFDTALLSAGSIDRSVAMSATRRWIQITGETSLVLETNVLGLDAGLVLRHGEADLGTVFQLLGRTATTSTITSRFREPR